MLQVQFQKKFLKDLENIPMPYRREIEHFVFEILPSLNSLAESGRFEKMTGYANSFKARFGDYRIGAYSSKNTIELRRVLHRREIYRYFP